VIAVAAQVIGAQRIDVDVEDSHARIATSVYAKPPNWLTSQRWIRAHSSRQANHGLPSSNGCPATQPFAFCAIGLAFFTMLA
jgi:hypothetical protein